MRRPRGWFNKELKTEVPIPAEFREHFQKKIKNESEHYGTDYYDLRASKN